jgi:hypothetical protein
MVKGDKSASMSPSSGKAPFHSKCHSILQRIDLVTVELFCKLGPSKHSSTFQAGEALRDAISNEQLGTGNKKNGNLRSSFRCSKFHIY